MEITVANTRGVKLATFKVPERGGVLELLGANGVGKSTVQDVFEEISGGRPEQSLAHRDGAPKGEARLGDLRLTIGKRVTKSGELQFTTLEDGRFSFADLVDPELKDPAAADAKRIKALVQLQGSTADPSLFYGLLGGQEAFQELVSASATETNDLVTMAARIKADLEKKARELEDRAEKENIRAQSARAAAEGIELAAPDDAEKLHEDLVLAIGEEAKLRQQARSALDAQYAHEEAARQLKLAEANYSGPEVSVARAQVETAKHEIADAAAQVAELELMLRRAKDVLLMKQITAKAAEETLYTAELYESTIAKWRKSLGANLPESPSDAQLAEARSDVEAAQAAVDQGTRVRDAKRRMAEAGEHATAAAQLRTQADRLREAGRGTDDVLSDAVQKLGCALKVSGGRLVTKTARSDEELFSDLSRGQRLKVACDVIIPAIGERGLFVIPQRFWEGLDPDNRQLVKDNLIGSGVTAVAARCTRGELRAEVAA